jgi:hypothetical protein
MFPFFQRGRNGPSVLLFQKGKEECALLSEKAIDDESPIYLRGNPRFTPVFRLRPD